MSAGEFDAYLKALGSLLRMKPGQRAELADEFRDHLETRLEELTAAGVPRAEAVETALEEFGDAAGLASQVSTAFTSLSRRRRRKFLMRITASAAATLACGLAVVYLFAPPNRALRPPGPALAQEGEAAADPPATAEPRGGEAVVEDPFVPDALYTKRLREWLTPDEVKAKRLSEALEEPSTLEILVPGESLSQGFDRLAERHGVTILSDVRALDLEGLDLRDIIIERPPKLEGFSLRTMMKVLLESVGDVPMTVLPRDGVLYVTTEKAAADYLDTRIYNVRDLLTDVRATSTHDRGRRGGPTEGRPWGTLPPGAEGDLVWMILSVTGGADAGGPWAAEEGGDEGPGGSVRHFDGLLAVRQTAAVHRQIEDLLAALRRSAGERGWEGAAVLNDPAEKTTLIGPNEPTIVYCRTAQTDLGRQGAEQFSTHLTDALKARGVTVRGMPRIVTALPTEDEQAQAARTAPASHVVVVDIDRFSLWEQDSGTLLRGRVYAQVSVRTLVGQELAVRPDLRVVIKHPPEIPVDSATQSAASFQKRVLEQFAAEVVDRLTGAWTAADAEPIHDPVRIEVGVKGVVGLRGGGLDAADPDDYRRLISVWARRNPARSAVVQVDADVSQQVVNQIVEDLSRAGLKSVDVLRADEPAAGD